MQRTSFWRVFGTAAVVLAAACSGDTPQSTSNPESPGAPPVPAPPSAYTSSSWDLTTGSPRTINDAIWTYPVPFNVGTGLINPFLGIQDAGDEEGFNTDGDFLYNQTRSNFTNPLPLNQVPVIRVGGTYYREFIFDANEANSFPDAYFSIDKLDFWVCTGTAAKTYTTISQFAGAGAPCVKVYFIEPITVGPANYVRALATDAATSGSGQALDYQILIPDSKFVAPAGGGSISTLCPYNPLALDCGYYLIVHARMGYFGTAAVGGDVEYVTGSTFEEFSTIKRGFVTISKTANTTLTRTYNWTITKSVTPTTINLWDGDNQDAAYQVVVNSTGSTDANWAVSGNIVITNPSNDAVTISGVTDNISGFGAAPVTCPVTFPHVLANGATLTCTYSTPLPDGTTRTNTANVELLDLAISSASAAVNFGAATVTDVNKTVNVTDTYPQPGGTTTALGTATAGVNTPRTFNYTRNYACGTDKGTKTNRARIVETNQTADATVTINCYNLTVTKTAVPARATTYAWTIDKKVKKQAEADALYASLKIFGLITGDEGVATYRVILDRTVTADVFSVTGVITMSNPASSSGPVVVRDVDDAILSPALTATITSCPGGNIPDGAVANYRSVAAGASLTCNYTATFASNPGAGTLTNRATVVGARPVDATKTFTDDETFSYSGVVPTVTGSASVTLTDPNDPSSPRGPYSDDVTVTYDKTFSCSNVGDNSNTASINTSPPQTSSATVRIVCTDPTVTKTATTSLTRKWDWTILKEENDPTFVPPGPLTLAVGQTYLFPYKVTVGIKPGWPQDSEWKTKGTIRVTNPPGQWVKLNSISDGITGGFAPAVSNCRLNGAGSAVTFPYLLMPPNYLECDWAETALPDATTRTNTATAVKQNRRWTSDEIATDIAASTRNYTGTASVNFTSATIKKVDNCIKVTDTPLGGTGTVLGTVCENDVPAPPRVFTFTLPIGPFEACGPGEFRNTADFTSAVVSPFATPRTGSSTVIIPIDIPCEGCTLTQGYWKTHNALFGINPRNGRRNGPPIHEFDNPLWNPYATWRFFGGTPAPRVAADPNGPVDIPPVGSPNWFAVWNTPPQGNPYYNAAHQFMGAMANLGNGAGGLASIQPAIGQAYVFFLTASPTTAWTDGQLEMLRGWNSLFGSYNEGLIGPGHCDEDRTSAP